MEIEEKEEKKPLERKFTYQDLINLSSDRYLTSFGEMITSDKPSSAAYSFGKGSRDVGPKLFVSEEMAEIDCSGKEGSGPATYFEQDNPTDYFQFPKAPAWRYMSKQDFERNAELRSREQSRPRYQYYGIVQDPELLNVQAADKIRRIRSANTLFGTGPRFTRGKRLKQTPGPQYQTVNRAQFVNTPSYSFGYKRMLKGLNSLEVASSTNEITGPGAYFTDDQSPSEKHLINRLPMTSEQPIPQRYSIGRAKRFGHMIEGQLEQTYQVKHKTLRERYDFNYDGGKGRKLPAKQEITPRNASANPLLKNRMLSYTFAKAKRDVRKGYFKDMMSTKPTPVRLSMPKF